MKSNLIRLPAAALAFALATGLAVAQTPAPAPAPAPTPAPTASHLAAARELIEVTGGMASVDQMIPAFAQQIRASAVTRPEMLKDLDEVLKNIEPELNLQRQQVVDTVSRTYAKYLTEPEMRQTTAFFKTPVGAKYISAQNQLVDEMVDNVTAWAQQASEYVMTRVRAEMGKRGHAIQ